MATKLSEFREVWLADFEFSAPPGERPLPVCLVAREFRSGPDYPALAGRMPGPIGATLSG